MLRLDHRFTLPFCQCTWTCLYTIQGQNERKIFVTVLVGWYWCLIMRTDPRLQHTSALLSNPILLFRRIGGLNLLNDSILGGRASGLRGSGHWGHLQVGLLLNSQGELKHWSFRGIVVFGSTCKYSFSTRCSHSHMWNLLLHLHMNFAAVLSRYFFKNIPFVLYCLQVHWRRNKTSPQWTGQGMKVFLIGCFLSFLPSSLLHFSNSTGTFVFVFVC